MPVASREHQKEQMYCAEQINIPVTLPSILKCYAKAAIRTQPYDLLSWTSAYFRALANGELPPVKERLEYPPYVHPSGITPRFLKILLNQYCHNEDWVNVIVTAEITPRTMSVKLESLLGRWRGMALEDKSLYQILMTGRLLELPGPHRVCDLYRFLAIACGLLGNNLFETMIYICELLTKEPDGGSAMISFRIFMNLYEYLADLDCSGGQSIIGPGQTDVEPSLERDESSLVRSYRSSLSSSTISSSSFTSRVSSNVKESRAVRCPSDDNSSEETETEESLCSFEVRPNRAEESASLDEASRSQAQTRHDTRIFEVGSSRKSCDCGDSTRQITSVRARVEVERTTTRTSQLDSTSENTTYDDRKHLELKVPKCTVERLGGGGTEVTRVQEERRRRRDVEIHSRAQKVSLMVEDQTWKTTAEPQLSLVSSSASSSRDGTSSSSSCKSHVVVVKDVVDCEMATRKKTMRQEFEKTDKILESRFIELVREAGGADVANVEYSSLSNGTIENIPRDREDSTIAPNVNIHRTNIKRIREKKLHKSADSQTGEKNGDNEKIVRDNSLEYDVPTTNDEDDYKSYKKRNSRRGRDEKNSSKGNNTEERKEGERNGGIRLDLVDVESLEDNGSVEDEEEFEEMAKYENIGTGNILEGICECLGTTKDTRDLESATTSGQRHESTPASQSIDVVAEFIERMRVTECPTGPYILPEVPGIGPPVSTETVTAVGLWLTECSRRQNGQVGPRNLRHFMCPDLNGKSRHEDCVKTKNTCSA